MKCTLPQSMILILRYVANLAEIDDKSKTRLFITTQASSIILWTTTICVDCIELYLYLSGHGLSRSQSTRERRVRWSKANWMRWNAVLVFALRWSRWSYVDCGWRRWLNCVARAPHTHIVVIQPPCDLRSPYTICAIVCALISALLLYAQCDQPTGIWIFDMRIFKQML